MLVPIYDNAESSPFTKPAAGHGHDTQESIRTIHPGFSKLTVELNVHVHLPPRSAFLPPTHTYILRLHNRKLYRELKPPSYANHQRRNMVVARIVVRDRWPDTSRTIRQEKWWHNLPTFHLCSSLGENHRCSMIRYQLFARSRCDIDGALVLFLATSTQLFTLPVLIPAHRSNIILTDYRAAKF